MEANVQLVALTAEARRLILGQIPGRHPPATEPAARSAPSANFVNYHHHYDDDDHHHHPGADCGHSDRGHGQRGEFRAQHGIARGQR